MSDMTIPDHCVDCGRNMLAGEIHTADCLSALRQDASDGDRQALATIGAIVNDMKKRAKTADGDALQNIINRGGYCAAFDYARNDKRYL